MFTKKSKINTYTKMASSDELQAAISYGLDKIGYKSIKPYQQEVIEHIVNGDDVFCCAATGEGKSLTFEILPFVLDFMKEKSNSITIVVSPLIALMQEKEKDMMGKGIKTAYLGNSAKLPGIRQGRYSIILASPEALVETHRDLLLSDIYQERVAAVFIDESHCVKKWGKDDPLTRQRAFRQSYGRIGELRSLFGCRTPFITLTATATKEVMASVITSLHMENCHKIILNPNKENIRYSVVSIKSSTDTLEIFQCLIDEILYKGIDAERTIVFFRQTQHMTNVYELFASCLGKYGYLPGSEIKNETTRLFAMYHRDTGEEIKSTVRDSFKDPHGTVRVLLCTIAYGMGMDVKGVKNIVHFGPSGDIDDYMQETGRGGRDKTEKCHAVLIKYPRCTGGHVSKDMKAYVKNDNECRRKLLLKTFSDEKVMSPIPHNCCDICDKECACLCKCESAECVCEEKCLHYSEYVSQIEQHHLDKSKSVKSQFEGCVKHPVSANVRRRVQNDLIVFRKMLLQNKTDTFIGDDIASGGMSLTLIRNVVHNLEYISGPSVLWDKFSFFSQDHAVKTYDIICTAMDEDEDDSENDRLEDDEGHLADAAGQPACMFSSDDSSTGDEIELLVKTRIHLGVSSDESSDSDSSSEHYEDL